MLETIARVTAEVTCLPERLKMTFQCHLILELEQLFSLLTVYMWDRE